MKPNNDNIIKSLFRSEVTWIISIVVVVWSFVATVVLPIQALQLGQTQIQAQLVSESNKYNESEQRITILEKNQAVVLSKLKIQ